MKCVLVVLLASMMATVNSCEFGNDGIQGLYDRAEVFRKTKVFDTTNRTVPMLQNYHYWYSERSDGRKRLGMKINDEYMLESYKNNAANEIETIVASYGANMMKQLELRRDDNGELIFRDFRKHDIVNFTLPSIDTELPNNAREEYKQVLFDLKTMRQKMFDFQNDLSKDDLERVQLFDYVIYSNGDFRSIYIENGGGRISIESAKKDGKETISGKISCYNFMLYNQKYNVVDGKVAVDGEPLVTR